MIGGQGKKIVKICRRLKWMVPNHSAIKTALKNGIKNIQATVMVEIVLKRHGQALYKVHFETSSVLIYL